MSIKAYIKTLKIFTLAVRRSGSMFSQQSVARRRRPGYVLLRHLVSIRLIMWLNLRENLRKDKEKVALGRGSLSGATSPRRKNRTRCRIMGKRDVNW